MWRDWYELDCSNERSRVVWYLREWLLSDSVKVLKQGRVEVMFIYPQDIADQGLFTTQGQDTVQSPHQYIDAHQPRMILNVC